MKEQQYVIIVLRGGVVACVEGPFASEREAHQYAHDIYGNEYVWLTCLVIEPQWHLE